MTSSRRIATATAGTIFTASLLAGIAPANAAGNTMHECTADGGVWVVVQAPAEFTGGEAFDKQGCATDPATGTDALKQIGVEITLKDSLISQLDGIPVEVPESFDGNYWNYWNTTPVVGSETEVNEWAYATSSAENSHPEPGSIEGWYYNNPGVENAVSSLPTTLDKPATDPAAAEAEGSDSAEQSEGSGVIGWVIAAAVVVIGAVAGGTVAARKRKAQN